ncbi:MAG: helix-turn-helix transcriptional regulator [Dorea sp.]
MTFDKKLKYLRTENQYTQDYVAKCLNVARSTIAGYETKNRQPSHEKLTALAELFHVSVDYLISDSDCIETFSSKLSINSADEEKLLTYYRALSAKSKEDLLSHCQLLKLRDKEERHTYV